MQRPRSWAPPGRHDGSSVFPRPLLAIRQCRRAGFHVKLLKVTTLYPTYISQFYEARRDLASQPYSEQKRDLDFDGFGWADYWSQVMGPLGWHMTELSANVEVLQRAWATEQGVAYESSDWMRSIVAAQILAAKPDVLFMEDYTTFSADWIRHVRDRTPSIRLVVGWCGAPFSDASVFSAYDVVLSNIPELVAWFHANGHRVHHVNHAFDPRILSRIEADRAPDIDVSFVGQISRAAHAHKERERMLSLLARRSALAIFSPTEPASFGSLTRASAKQALFAIASGARQVGLGTAFASLPVIGRAARWHNAPVRPIGGVLGRSLRPPVFGLEMFATLRKSKVTLNSHIDLSRDSASNMRLFEATGAGACLLTDAKSNLSTLFEAGKEVVTYRTPEECLENASWLLQHGDAREEIARAGQRRTLTDHTFAQRAPLLDSILRTELK